MPPPPLEKISSLSFKLKIDHKFWFGLIAFLLFLGIVSATTIITDTDIITSNWLNASSINISSIGYFANLISNNWVNATNINATSVYGSQLSGILGWGNLTGYNLNSAWTGLLGFGNLTAFNLNQAWTGLLGWGNLTGYNLGVSWLGSLGGGNITAGSISNSQLAAGIFSAITGLGFQSQNLNMGTNSIVNASWVNATNVNVTGWINASNAYIADVVIQQGSGTEVASYIIFTDGTNVYAKNGSTGAIGFQSTNASYVIQQAINALPASGGRIVLREGAFNITAAYIDLKSNLTIEGQGYSTVLVKGSSPNVVTMLYARSSTSPHRNIEIRNLKIDAGNPINRTNLFLGYNIDGLMVDNVQFVAGSNRNGTIYIINSSHIKLLNSFFNGTFLQVSGYGGIVDDTSINSKDVLVQGNTFINTAPSTFAVGNIVKSWRIIGNYFNNGYSAIDISFSPDSVIDGNTIYNFTTEGIYSEGGRNLVISNNVVDGNNVSTTGIMVQDNIGIGNDIPGKVVIANNVVHDIKGNCISSNGVPRVLISGNMISGCNGHGIMLTSKTALDSSIQYSHYGMVEENYIFNFGRVTSYSRGIALYWTNYSMVRDNLIDGNNNQNATNCIIMNSGTNNTDVRNNICRGQASTVISDAGINNTKRGNTGYITENSGNTTIVNGTTSVAVNHGLSVTPFAGAIMVTPAESLGNATFYWVDTYTSTQFTIRVNQDPVKNVTFAWQAEVL